MAQRDNTPGSTVRGVRHLASISTHRPTVKRPPSFIFPHPLDQSGNSYHAMRWSSRNMAQLSAFWWIHSTLNRDRQDFAVGRLGLTSTRQILTPRSGSTNHPRHRSTGQDCGSTEKPTPAGGEASPDKRHGYGAFQSVGTVVRFSTRGTPWFRMFGTERDAQNTSFSSRA